MTHHISDAPEEEQVFIREIKVGEYEHGIGEPARSFDANGNVTAEWQSRYSRHHFGGTNAWDALIRKHGLENVELEVILREKKRGP